MTCNMPSVYDITRKLKFRYSPCCRAASYSVISQATVTQLSTQSLLIGMPFNCTTIDSGNGLRLMFSVLMSDAMLRPGLEWFFFALTISVSHCNICHGPSSLFHHSVLLGFFLPVKMVVKLIN